MNVHPVSLSHPDYIIVWKNSLRCLAAVSALLRHVLSGGAAVQRELFFAGPVFFAHPALEIRQVF